MGFVVGKRVYCEKDQTTTKTSCTVYKIGRCLKDIGINFPGKWGAFASSGGMGAWINAAEPLLNGPGYECDGLDGEFVNNYIASA